MQPNWWAPYWHPDLEILQSVMKTFSSSSRSLSISSDGYPWWSSLAGWRITQKTAPIWAFEGISRETYLGREAPLCAGCYLSMGWILGLNEKNRRRKPAVQSICPLCSLTADTGWPISSCSGCWRWELSLSPCLPCPNRLFSQTVSHKTKLKLLSSHVLPQQPDKSLIQKMGPEAWVCRCSSPCSSSDLRTGWQHECGWVWSRGREKALNAINRA